MKNIFQTIVKLPREKSPIIRESSQFFLHSHPPLHKTLASQIQPFKAAIFHYIIYVHSEKYFLTLILMFFFFLKCRSLRLFFIFWLGFFSIFLCHLILMQLKIDSRLIIFFVLLFKNVNNDHFKIFFLCVCVFMYACESFTRDTNG